MKVRRKARARPCVPLQERLLARALADVGSAVFICDRTGRIVWANEAFSRLSGYSGGEVVGHTPSFLKSGRQDVSFYQNLWRTIQADPECLLRNADRAMYLAKRRGLGNYEFYDASRSSQ